MIRSTATIEIFAKSQDFESELFDGVSGNIFCSLSFASMVSKVSLTVSSFGKQEKEALIF